MKELRERLLLGEQEKIALLRQLLRQQRNDELQQQHRNESGSYPTYNNQVQCNQVSGSMTSLTSTGSGATSPFDGSDENLSSFELMPFEPRTNHKRQLRKDHQLALQRISDLQGALEVLDYHIEANRSAPEQQRFNLAQEKEALLMELDRFETYVRTEEERMVVEDEKESLLRELMSARVVSERAYEDRVQLERERQLLKQQLVQKTRQTSLLEMKLKSLSDSTLSVSSGSSLAGSYSTGSRGSLSASSRGSLSSLPSHTDNGGGAGGAPGTAAPFSLCPPIYESHILAAASAAPQTPPNYSTVGGCFSGGAIPTADVNGVTELTNERLQAKADRDSGVYEVSVTSSSRNSVARHDSGHSTGRSSVVSGMSDPDLDQVAHVTDMGEDHVTQVRLAMSYEEAAERLTLSIEKVRHMEAVCAHEFQHVHLKGRLLPHGPQHNGHAFKTSKAACGGGGGGGGGGSSAEYRGGVAAFQEQFVLKLSKTRLAQKTLQLELVAACVGNRKPVHIAHAQISLAELACSQSATGMKWYNLLPCNNWLAVATNGDAADPVTSQSETSVDGGDALQQRVRSNSWRTNTWGACALATDLARSASDCSGTGQRACPGGLVQQQPFERLTAVRRSMRRATDPGGRLLCSQYNPGGEQTSCEQPGDMVALNSFAQLTYGDLEKELQTACTKETQLSSELAHLHEIKKLMDREQAAGQTQIDWLHGQSRDLVSAQALEQQLIANHVTTAQNPQQQLPPRDLQASRDLQPSRELQPSRDLQSSRDLQPSRDLQASRDLQIRSTEPELSAIATPFVRPPLPGACAVSSKPEQVSVHEQQRPTSSRRRSNQSSSSNIAVARGEHSSDQVTAQVHWV